MKPSTKAIEAQIAAAARPAETALGKLETEAKVEVAAITTEISLHRLKALNLVFLAVNLAVGAYRIYELLRHA